MFRRAAGEAARFKRYPYGPLGARLVFAVIALVVGVGFAVVGAIGLAAGHKSAVILICGIVLVVVGAGGLLLARWMAKRGI